MNVILWITIGLIEGWVASSAYEKTQKHFIFDVIVGVIGGLMGGFALSAYYEPKIIGNIKLFSTLGAMGGGVLLLFLAVYAHSIKKSSRDFFLHE